MIFNMKQLFYYKIYIPKLICDISWEESHCKGGVKSFWLKVTNSFNNMHWFIVHNKTKYGLFCFRVNLKCLQGRFGRLCQCGKRLLADSAASFFFTATCGTGTMRVIASVHPHQSITSKHTFVCLVFTIPPYCSEWRDLKYVVHNTSQDKAVSRQQRFERAWQFMHVLESSMMHFMHRHCPSPSIPPSTYTPMSTDRWHFASEKESMFVPLWAQKKAV